MHIIQSLLTQIIQNILNLLRRDNDLNFQCYPMVYAQKIQQTYETPVSYFEDQWLHCSHVNVINWHFKNVMIT